MEVLLEYLAAAADRRLASAPDGAGRPAAAWRPVSRRRIRCAAADRDVEVTFVVRGIFPFRRLVGVAACTAFDPSEAVACTRRCLDPAFRRQWEPPLPVRH
jgi:hypothetical protein